MDPTMSVGWSIFWSIAAMPIGLFICFFPLVLAWIGTAKESSDQNSPKRKK
ncbi:MAG TPA: hypothetical protein VEH27_18870 [Methylomirabilota bacterium]|nr:hypothetical protein [Methylomirabilota bacterium]